MEWLQTPSFFVMQQLTSKQPAQKYHARVLGAKSIHYLKLLHELKAWKTTSENRPLSLWDNPQLQLRGCLVGFLKSVSLNVRDEHTVLLVVCVWLELPEYYRHLVQSWEFGGGMHQHIMFSFQLSGLAWLSRVAQGLVQTGISVLREAPCLEEEHCDPALHPPSDGSCCWGGELPRLN